MSLKSAQAQRSSIWMDVNVKMGRRHYSSPVFISTAALRLVMNQALFLICHRGHNMTEAFFTSFNLATFCASRRKNTVKTRNVLNAHDLSQ